MADFSDSRMDPGTSPPGDAPPVSGLPHPYHSLDPNGVILTVNDAWLEALGYEREDVEGRPFSDFLPNVTAEEFEEQFWAFTDAGSVENLEDELLRADGDTIDVSFAGTVEYADGDTVERIHCQFTEITERKKREAELDSEKAFIQSSLDALSDVFYVFDTAGTLLEYNDKLPAVTGYDPAELESLGPTSFFSPERRQAMYDRYELVVEEAEQIRFEEPLLTKEGETIPYEFTASPYREASGDVAGFVGIGRNISDRVERERKLTAYEQAVEGSSDLLSAVDTDHVFLFTNRVYREYHDLLDEDVREKSLETVLGEERFETIKPHLDRALEGETVEYEMERPGPDGSQRTLDIRYYPLRDDTGDIRGVAAAMRDVTEQKEIKAELAERNRQLTVMDRILRHNLQNEMNVIQGYADLIQEAGSGEVTSYAETIDETTGRLLNTADKQREITKLLASQPSTEEFDLSTVVQRSVGEVRDRYPQATITQSVPETLSAIATQHLETAIQELLGNAIHYSDRSAPTVTIRARQDQESAVVRIEDQGPGIPEMERKVLTGEEEIAPLYHGSGLGLWLVNVIVEQSGGSLTFEKNDPRGSIVTIRLPRN